MCEDRTVSCVYVERKKECVCLCARVFEWFAHFCLRKRLSFIVLLTQDNKTLYCQVRIT